jgi:hypothetical protein
MAATAHRLQWCRAPLPTAAAAVWFALAHLMRPGIYVAGWLAGSRALQFDWIPLANNALKRQGWHEL